MRREEAALVASERACQRATIQRRPPLAGEVRAMAERLLVRHSVTKTMSALADAGFDATYSQVDSVRRTLTKQGRMTAPRERNHGGGGFLPADVPALECSTQPITAAQLGCESLLRRQLQTGAHWITDPAVFAAACESVGLAA